MPGLHTQSMEANHIDAYQAARNNRLKIAPFPPAVKMLPLR